MPSLRSACRLFLEADRLPAILNAMVSSRKLEPARRVYRIAQIDLDESVLADDAGHHISRMSADANLALAQTANST